MFVDLYKMLMSFPHVKACYETALSSSWGQLDHSPPLPYPSEGPSQIYCSNEKEDGEREAVNE